MCRGECEAWLPSRWRTNIVLLHPIGAVAIVAQFQGMLNHWRTIGANIKRQWQFSKINGETTDNCLGNKGVFRRNLRILRLSDLPRSRPPGVPIGAGFQSGRARSHDRGEPPKRGRGRSSGGCSGGCNRATLEVASREFPRAMATWRACGSPDLFPSLPRGEKPLRDGSLYRSCRSVSGHSHRVFPNVCKAPKFGRCLPRGIASETMMRSKN